MLRDADLDARRLMFEINDSRRPEDRHAVAIELSDVARSIAAEGIRSRHPAYTDAEVDLALKRLLVGDALFRAAWPGAPVLYA